MHEQRDWLREHSLFDETASEIVLKEEDGTW